MYSKLALALVAVVGSVALAASAQPPNPSDNSVSRTYYYRTPGIASPQPVPSPAQQESSSATVTSTRPGQNPNGGLGGMARGGMAGGMGGGVKEYSDVGALQSFYLGRMLRGKAETFPEDFSIAHETDQLIRQLGEAKSDSDRDKLKVKLGEILEKQFEQRQKRHEGEIAELEAQVKKLKDLVAKRQENRREIVARRLEQVLRESQGLGW